MPRVFKPKDINALDPARRLIYERMVDMGSDLSTLSTAIGRNKTYLWQFMSRNNPQALPEEARHRLARILGVTEPELRGETLAEIMKQPEPPIQEMLTIRPDLPLKGRVVPGAEFLAWEGGRVQRMTERPAALASSTRGFAVPVSDETMIPRYYPGEKVFVDPDEPLSRNCFVFVVLDDDTAIIRQYLEFEDGDLALFQLRDKETTRIHRSRIQLLGRIVGSSEK